MPDFGALNELRLETLRQLREMVSAEATPWTHYSGGQSTPELATAIERDRARFRALWNQHAAIRKQMTDAGLMPPPDSSGDLPEVSLHDPLRLKIEERLKSELTAARLEYDTVNQEFRLFLQKGTGIPAPDGSLRAKQIAGLHSFALRKYTGAMRRFSQFLEEGTIGEE